MIQLNRHQIRITICIRPATRGGAGGPNFFWGSRGPKFF